MKRTLLLIGIVFWLLGVLAFRFAGQYFFITTSAAGMIAVFVAVALAMPLFVRWAIVRFASGLDPSEATLWLLLLPMLLDSACILSFGLVFPNMAASTASIVAAWLLFGYAAGFSAALMRRTSAS